MIITNHDLVEFEFALECCYSRRRLQLNERGAYYAGHERDLRFTDWLADHPQILMAGAGLQEYVGAHELPLYRRLVKASFLIGGKRPAFRDFSGQWFIPTGWVGTRLHGHSITALEHALSFAEDDNVLDALIDQAVVKLGTPSEILRNAARHLDSGLQDTTVLVSPQLWTPNHQDAQKLALQNTAIPLIKALQAETRDLTSLHWRELEAVVAEILRSSGMQIHQVLENPQGGRDIIARAQLLPGEIVTLAVEVKHRRTVDRPVLHTALHQNSHFPALMLVTSGRFTAGVVREAEKPQNKMRLFLKDGVAIREMIKTYMFGPQSHR